MVRSCGRSFDWAAMVLGNGEQPRPGIQRPRSQEDVSCGNDELFLEAFEVLIAGNALEEENSIYEEFTCWSYSS